VFSFPLNYDCAIIKPAASEYVVDLQTNEITSSQFSVYGEIAHGEIAHGEIAHGEIAHGEIAHGEIAHGKIAHGEIALTAFAL
jgi:hypothetical protein